jgi:DNA-binding Lrp family transcriptional regulator
VGGSRLPGTMGGRAMTGIDYIRIDADILHRQDLNCTEKMIAGLVKSFNSKGLVLTNEEIAQLAGVRPDTISKILSGLTKKKVISITGAQSKYRKIYFGENPKVNSGVLGDKSQSKKDSTLENNPPTLEKTPNITKKTKVTKSLSKREVKKFVPPTIEEIQSYITENRLSVDGNFFMKYFIASNWTDSRGNKVKNWKQKLLTWNNHEQKKGNKLPRITREVKNDGKYQTITTG